MRWNPPIKSGSQRGFFICIMNDNLNNLRHSCAHLLAAAVMELWPDTKRTIGPAIDSGFYYDFEFKHPISEADLPKIEKKMQDILKSWDKFERIEKNITDAKEFIKDNPYKLELIQGLSKEGEKIVSFYKSGNFTDLCEGGHIEDPKKEIGAFKLTQIAGAYWRGNSKNKMLTRIYGTCFATKEELEKYLKQVEEAKKRDHRKLGKELEIFTVSEEVGQGLILWLPKGTIIKDTLENWAKETEKECGYQRVSTPEITKAGLYYTSGHLPYYKNDMYPPMKGEGGEEYYLKPMNCPHHHMIFKAKNRSYKDLPLRLAEYGRCYRHEASGELFGLLRVRGMTQNDAHIYCTEEQAVDEFVKVMKLHQYYYDTLGIKDYYLELSLRDPQKKDKYHGDEAMWQKAEKLMKKAVEKTAIRMEIEEGNAAFYGPKIDFVIRSSIGRTFAISTNQLDLYMGKRFNLTYIDETGAEKTPVIIHRAPLGSSERFIGFLIEHYGGNFPLWLAPTQLLLIPIAERHLEFAKKVKKIFEEKGFRVEIDNRNERMQAKIRNGQLQKVPYLGIIGDKEAQKQDVISIRSRERGDLGIKKINEFTQEFQETVFSKR